MATEESIAPAEAAIARDPRQFPIGYISSAGSGDMFTAAFGWFSTVEDLADFLHSVEPGIYDLSPGDGLEG